MKVLSLSLIKYHAMRRYGGVDVLLLRAESFIY
jgi:hypothetical protein